MTDRFPPTSQPKPQPDDAARPREQTLERSTQDRDHPARDPVPVINDWASI